ncbi:MAG: NAD(P)-binding protein [Planctomycetes bacterium]|nr:NAD(P)-binding protein [Planctomycetota bacterium]
MRTAVRGHENPALDVALAIGARLGLPVLVYHALGERHPFASDRLHAFALQGARDAAAELATRGVRYALHVERAGHRGPHLRTLAERAALVVTEDMPVPPLRDWTARLAARAPGPVWTVDTACVVPMPLVARRPERAFAFRDATRVSRAERVLRPWPEPVAAVVPAAALELPFEPVDAATVDLDALLASCDIDHTVAPVRDTAGGSRAGYARFAEFLARLRAYARDRNDPLRDGVSRLSPYLHFGHVSPLRIAREVAAVGGAGADKFLDELLVWRELAYAWAARTADPHDPADALPAWALATLREHERDPRPALRSLETLARGRTGDALWDAAQRSLLRHGELHNNLRMTWGKALPEWTPDVATCMERLVELNHRYALDGRDPASYGGLWWCLGLFDRPFEPAQPVLGAVRPRPTEAHAGRLDVARYAARVDRPIAGRPLRALVVGAGIAGLACARALHDHGIDVLVADKGRGPGGRASTRRTDGGLWFDHGAQFFTARSEPFRRHVASWLEDGVVARWDARIVTLRDGRVEPDPRPGDRYVGTPGMSALAGHLGADLAVRQRVRVAALGRDGGRWHATDGDGQAVDARGFDLVLCALPAPQAAELLAPIAPALAARARAVVLTPCVATMVAFAAPLAVPFDAAFVAGDPVLAWLARDSSKPGRAARPETFVLHATPEWSAGHDGAIDVAQLAAPSLDALARAQGGALPAVLHCDVHRWSFATPVEPLTDASLFDAAHGIGACGDWCGGPRVEGAWRSGCDLAGRVLRAATLTEPTGPR